MRRERAPTLRRHLYIVLGAVSLVVSACSAGGRDDTASPAHAYRTAKFDVTYEFGATSAGETVTGTARWRRNGEAANRVDVDFVRDGVASHLVFVQSASTRAFCAERNGAASRGICVDIGDAAASSHPDPRMVQLIVADSTPRSARIVAGEDADCFGVAGHDQCFSRDGIPLVLNGSTGQGIWFLLATPWLGGPVLTPSNVAVWTTTTATAKHVDRVVDDAAFDAPFAVVPGPPCRLEPQGCPSLGR